MKYEISAMLALGGSAVANTLSTDGKHGLPWALDRSAFIRDWKLAASFTQLVTFVPLTILLNPQAVQQGIILTIANSTLLLAIGWWFLWREQTYPCTVGVGKRAWLIGVIMFLI